MALLDEVKYNLAVAGTAEDASIEKIILRGKAHLEGLAGATLNFDSEGLPKSLLLDLCRYIYNNAAEYFEENFKKEILRMQLQTAVSEDAET